MREHDEVRLAACLRHKVFRRDQGQARDARQMRVHERAEFRRSVYRSADGGAAKVQFVQVGDYFGDSPPIALNRRGERKKLRAERYGNRVLQVRPPELFDIIEFFRFPLKYAHGFVHGAKQFFCHTRRGDLERRRVHVVCGLPAIHVVKRVHADFLF